MLRFLIALLFNRTAAQLIRTLGPALLAIVLGRLRGKGLTDLIGRAHSTGLGDKADSWVSRGENKLLSPEEVDRLIDRAEIQATSQRVGLPEDEIRERLAKALPKVVDTVTPDGDVPDPERLDAMIDKIGRALPKR